MSTFKRYFLYDALSFLFVTLILSALAVFSQMAGSSFFSWPADLPWRVFVITSTISVLMFFTDKLPISTAWLAILVQICDVALVVFVLGAPLGLFTLQWPNVPIILGILLITYFGVFAVTAIRSKSDANAINDQIQKQREKNHAEHH